MTDPQYTPFNLWQMRNCAACSIPEPCEKRRIFLEKFERNGSIALIKECPEKVPS